jgi:hypothetical protein
MTMESSHIGLFARGAVLGALALLAGCSSSSTPNGGTPAPKSDGGIGRAEDQPVIAGTGGNCQALTAFTTAAKITVTTTWPASIAVDGCNAASTPPCTAPFTIWLLTNYTVSGTTITTQTKTCGNVSPPVTLNATGDIATGVPSGQIGMVENTFPSTIWDKPMMPITAGTGTIGGFDIGSSTTINTSTTLIGFVPTSTLANSATPWPTLASGLNMADLFDSDSDNHLGITGLPLSMGNYYLPRTSASASSPAASQLYIVSRTTLSLYGTATSCTEFSGAAYVSQLQNHIIGCMQTDGNLCVDGDPNQGSGWIDSNTTKFQPVNTPGLAAGATGTFVAQQLPKGTAATCDDVLAAYPDTSGIPSAPTEDAGSSPDGG